MMGQSSITSQLPFLLLPTLTMMPSDFSLDSTVPTVLWEIPRESAISALVTCGSARIIPITLDSLTSLLADLIDCVGLARLSLTFHQQALVIT